MTQERTMHYITEIRKLTDESMDDNKAFRTNVTDLLNELEQALFGIRDPAPGEFVLARSTDVLDIFKGLEGQVKGTVDAVKMIWSILNQINLASGVFELETTKVLEKINNDIALAFQVTNPSEFIANSQRESLALSRLLSDLSLWVESSITVLSIIAAGDDEAKQKHINRGVELSKEALMASKTIASRFTD